MILSESLEYVRSLSDEMSDFKAQAVKFRASVEKMSKDILESIDQSEVYNLINEESKSQNKISTITGFSIIETNTILTALELKGFIKELNGGIFVVD